MVEEGIKERFERARERIKEAEHCNEDRGRSVRVTRTNAALLELCDAIIFVLENPPIIIVSGE